MLILTRHEREGVILKVGQHVAHIEVRRIDGGRVTLAIEAPMDVRILRDELEDLDSLPPDGETLRKMAK